jgi:hypothetical protein
MYTSSNDACTWQQRGSGDDIAFYRVGVRAAQNPKFHVQGVLRAVTRSWCKERSGCHEAYREGRDDGDDLDDVGVVHLTQQAHLQKDKTHGDTKEDG